jgi:membrane-associated protein
MDAVLHDLVVDHGAVFVFLGAFISCLGLPVPASMILLVAGAVSAGANGSAAAFFAAGYVAAIAAGTLLFALGRRGGTGIVARLASQPGWGALVARARALISTRGGAAVFIGSSFIAQIGPAVNLLSGAGGLPFARFQAWQLGGRAIWVGGYLALGRVFSDQIAEVALLVANLSGLIFELLLILGMVLLLRRILRRREG